MLKRYTPLRQNKPMQRAWMKRRAPKRLRRRSALDAMGRWVRAQSCICCGRPGPSDAAHITLSRNEKGMGMKVSDAQRVPLCKGPRGCHRQWDTHAGRFSGWSDAERYETGGDWVGRVQLALIPGDNRTQALDLQALGLGTIEDHPDGSWAWVPSHSGAP